MAKGYIKGIGGGAGGGSISESNTVLSSLVTSAITASKGSLMTVLGFNVANGQPEIVLADSTFSGRRPAYGALQDDVVVGDKDIRMLIIGELSGVFTQGITAGSPLFLRDSGTFQTTEDVNFSQYVGYVIEDGNIVNGKIQFVITAPIILSIDDNFVITGGRTIEAGL